MRTGHELLYLKTALETMADQLALAWYLNYFIKYLLKNRLLKRRKTTLCKGANLVSCIINRA